MVRNFLTEPVFGDPEIEALFGNTALSKAMLEVEAALARAQAGLDIIPTAAADAISASARQLVIPTEVLSEGVSNTGIPVPALVKALRADVGYPHADWVHWGATSQDIIDNGLSLCYRNALVQLQTRLGDLIDTLAQHSKSYSSTLMAARTRGQLATPTTFGLRVAQWAQPLISCELDLKRVSEQALRVQFGGASGNQTAIAPNGPAIADSLARELNLAPGLPWHTDRSGLNRLSAWLVSVTTALGKIAHDMAILSRSEVAEAFGGTGGGSSTMPHKSNPVTVEAILSLSQLALTYGGGLAATGIHGEERDGPNWTLEWLYLPDLFVMCGRALSHGLVLTRNLKVNAETMQRRIEDSPEVMAEAAVFALSHHVGRQQASMIVAQALSQPEPLPSALAKLEPTLDWQSALDPANVVEPSKQIAEDIFVQRQI